jgi:hypothetical protein
MGDGSTEATAEIGTLSGTIYDQFGNESNKIEIEEVSYLPEGAFSLFRHTQMTSKGWIMGGSNKSIQIEKGHNKVFFGMMIPMSKGILFVIHFTRDMKMNVTKSIVGGGRNLESGEGITESEIGSKIGSKIRIENCRQ